MNYLHNYTIAIIVVILTIYSWGLQASTCITVGSGDWATPGIWNCEPGGGSVDCGRTQIIIQPGHTITVANQYNFLNCSQPMHLVVHGNLDFTNGNKLDLPCGSVVEIMPGGKIFKSTPGGGSSTLVAICNDNWWIAGNGDQQGYQVWGASPLPVELISFEINTKGKDVHASWTTATEVNSDYFELSRSRDLEEWQVVGRVSAAGMASTVRHYRFVDRNAPQGTNYYRLKQVDYNGLGGVIAIQSVVVDDAAWEVWPNPSIGQFNIRHQNKLSEYNYRLLDISGRPVNIASSFGNGEIQISTFGLAPGNYLLVVEDRSGQIVTRKKVIIH
ncbi:MAG: T9SS C-terminal target domain-containing protein [Cryomorphaceae bacterium]|nr:MAG: T9SS C-terminal target domain-containing protein [Cryomorphaceae bacterium]